MIVTIGINQLYPASPEKYSCLFQSHSVYETLGIHNLNDEQDIEKIGDLFIRLLLQLPLSLAAKH